MLTVEDIQNITFRKAGLGGGYKVDDVDEFVDNVVETVNALELENKELKSRIEAQDKEILEHKEKEESVQSALISAQMTAKQIVMEATMKSDEQLSKSKEESEKVVRDAKEEAEKVLSEAKEKAEKLVIDAQERADRKNAETDAQVDEVLNKALAESSEKIEENNLILEQQKKNIIRLMGEANKFRNSLVQAYKEHLKVINTMSKAEDYKNKQKELDENYPPMHGNAPVVTVKEEPAAPAPELTEEKTEAAEEIMPAAIEDSTPEAPAAEEKTETAAEEAKSEEAPEETKAEEAPAEKDDSEDEGVVFFAGAKETEKTPEKEETENNRQPIVFEMSHPETVSGMLKVDEPASAAPAENRQSKKNKHKKRR